MVEGMYGLFSWCMCWFVCCDKYESTVSIVVITSGWYATLLLLLVFISSIYSIIQNNNYIIIINISWWIFCLGIAMNDKSNVTDCHLVDHMQHYSFMQRSSTCHLDGSNPGWTGRNIGGQVAEG